MGEIRPDSCIRWVIFGLRLCRTPRLQGISCGVWGANALRTMYIKSVLCTHNFHKNNNTSFLTITAHHLLATCSDEYPYFYLAPHTCDSYEPGSIFYETTMSPSSTSHFLQLLQPLKLLSAHRASSFHDRTSSEFILPFDRSNSSVHPTGNSSIRPEIRPSVRKSIRTESSLSGIEELDTGWAKLNNSINLSPNWSKWTS